MTSYRVPHGFVFLRLQIPNEWVREPVSGLELSTLRLHAGRDVEEHTDCSIRGGPTWLFYGCEYRREGNLCLEYPLPSGRSFEEHLDSSDSAGAISFVLNFKNNSFPPSLSSCLLSLSLSL